MNLDLLTSSYDYTLPSELIASRPLASRHDSRLLVYHQKYDEIIHTQFLHLSDFLDSDDCLVFNQTKVFPCRLEVQKQTGGKAEIFFLQNELVDKSAQVLIKTNRKKKIGERLYFKNNIHDEYFQIEELLGDGSFKISTSVEKLSEFLKDYASVPIPPYIRGGVADQLDKTQYQTIYAKEEGSVAAPTAGFHFSEEVFQKLDQKSIHKAFVNLHVGLGTFKPIQTEDIREHQMHSERYFVDSSNCELLNKHQDSLVAVGTTSLRTLESLYNSKQKIFPEMNSYKETNLFLFPGRTIHTLKALITNFHLPKSSLLMLVSAVLGREKTLALYREAISRKYRFYSYGDAMMIIPDRKQYEESSDVVV
ncbi:MAG: tRNA preQ1(34) S-adenosylmethionine ribosyltransferase-isomerase QueA [Halobacteriovoraceae bacterium]|nr:tRNA preQ1(34) S-adenosylmethionine ribosyltransferase-isomerase QueA [Halobacteriovoraceae bacterium]MCB9095161.1 tRNA preQ1(34) S-adenosylmethionine ribosyltransferase-isomerase QueA [Halobacteriovoraceae bacterium]